MRLNQLISLPLVFNFSLKKKTDSKSEEDVSETPLQRVFVRYQVRHQKRIFAFILTLVPDWNDAEEILQETSIVLWKKFSEFEIGTDFGKWARAVARIEIRKFYGKKGRDRRILSEEVVAALIKDFDSDPHDFDERGTALRSCLKNLSKKDFELIFSRYVTQSATNSIASQLGRTVESVCNSLRRIRERLLKCILKELHNE